MANEFVARRGLIAQANSVITGSLAQGAPGNITSGPYSHAEGASTSATATAAHAEGASTQANGNYSHAEGDSTIASGIYSHAEGSGTTASGTAAHAEGSTTTASGTTAHAEGYGTTALGTYSHAEGFNTTTNGAAAHAEGYTTIADGDYSHAEGTSTRAIGGYSHAEGNTTSTGQNYAFHTNNISSGVIILDNTYGNLTSYLTPGQLLYFDDTAFNNDYGQISYTIASSSYDGSKTSIFLPDLTITTSEAYVGPLTHVTSWQGLGGDSTVKGLYTHTEGISTYALGEQAHAEGNTAVAAGVASHAEGSNTRAGKIASHAEGNTTVAAGDYSHAEGNQTTAYGTGTHTEGYSTKTGVFGYNSTSIVSGVVTLDLSYGTVKTYLTSQGGEFITLYDGDNDDIYGTQTFAVQGITDGAGYTFINLVDTSVNTTQAYIGVPGVYQPTGADRVIPGEYSHTEGRDTSAIQRYSHAEGVTTQAIGEGAHAEGYRTFTVGNYQHAAGMWNRPTAGDGVFIIGNGTADNARSNLFAASGSLVRIGGNLNVDSTIYGNSTIQAAGGFLGNLTGVASSATTASNALTASYVNPLRQLVQISGSLIQGIFVTASGLFSHAEGSNNHASGAYSHAEGYQTIASASYSHAEGRGTVALGGHSHAEGFQTTTRGDFSHAEGSGTIASGIYSHAEGDTTIASGSYSHAEGHITTASGSYSHAEGKSTIAIGAYSHAEGDTTTAVGDYSHAEGRSTIAFAKWSHAEGQETVAAGGYSHAEGYLTSASAQYSHAEGWGTVASGAYQHVQGQYNISSSAQSAFILGNGTADNARSNLIFASGSQVEITGSLRGQVSALSIASNTASINLTSNNFFTLNLVNGANTHISASNIRPGQTINLRVSQSSAGTGTVSFHSAIEQPSGSPYTGSMVANAEDIVTFISFDSTKLYASAIRNLV